MALDSDSSITIDGYTVAAHSSVVMLWEHVIAIAGERGESFWLRSDTGDRIESVLVRPGSVVRSTLSREGQEAGELPIDKATNSNLAAVVDLYVKPSADIWPLAKALGLDREIRANHAAEAVEDAD